MDSHCSYLERSLLWRISRTATLRLYKKKSGVTLWRSPGYKIIMYMYYRNSYNIKGSGL